MNLVRVEYYFSEILSAMETEDKILRLYSPYDYAARERRLVQKIIPFCEEFAALSSENQDLWLKQHKEKELCSLKEQWDTLHRYQAKFVLPKNVQFAGTLNMDETTKELSPKVLDRSFIIEIGREASAFQGTEDEASSSAAQRMEQLTELLQQMDALTPQRGSISLSRRAQAQANRLFERGLRIEDILLGKILLALWYTDLEPEELERLTALEE